MVPRLIIIILAMRNLAIFACRDGSGGSKASTAVTALVFESEYFVGGLLAGTNIVGDALDNVDEFPVLIEFE